MGCWAEGSGSGGGGRCWNTHCSIHSEAGLGLSCKACTRISCNSLSYTEWGEGWKMLSLPALFPGLPKSGWKNECRECSERAVAQGERKGENASLCNSSSFCIVWLFTKETLDTAWLPTLFVHFTWNNPPPAPVCHAAHYTKAVKVHQT